ncbi:MAG: dodecin family protein [Planctomycetes bacterium]|nr:dodecin family protein [Planctomycetota bacterium]
MAVARVTELVASSDKSFDDAIKAGVSRATKTLRGITGVEIVRQTIKVEKNKIQEYRVHINVTFVLEG